MPGGARHDQPSNERGDRRAFAPDRNSNAIREGNAMTSNQSAVKVAILDDYQNVALQMADWSPLAGRATVAVFDDHLDDPDAVAARLAPFEVVCVMRERTPLTRGLLERLPRLKLIASTGFINAAIDRQAAAERGIAIAYTGYESTPTIEMTWALILASARHVAAESASLRSGGWQRSIGNDLKGKTLGGAGQYRRRGGPDRACLRHEGDRVEREPHRGKSRRSGRRARAEERAVPAIGRSDHPPHS